MLRFDSRSKRFQEGVVLYKVTPMLTPSHSKDTTRKDTARKDTARKDTARKDTARNGADSSGVSSSRGSSSKDTDALKSPDARGSSVGKDAKEPRKRRKSAVFDSDGNEVLITMMCLKCRQMKPLGMFGLRRMSDGAIRNQPWCRSCRSGAGAKATASKRDELKREAIRDGSRPEEQRRELDGAPAELRELDGALGEPLSGDHADQDATSGLDEPETVDAMAVVPTP
jgi:hypothetical protein